MFDPDYPVLLVLAGKAGVGKTRIANALLQPTGITTGPESDFLVSERSPYPIWWDAFSVATPLYRLLTARTRIEGTDKQDRTYYEILNTLLATLGSTPVGGAPPYKQLLQMVEDLYRYPLSSSDDKQRTFLRFAADQVRSHKEDALLRHLTNTITQRAAMHTAEVERDLEELELHYPDQAFMPKHYGAVVSDLRMDSEVEYLQKQPNCLIVKLICDEDVREARLIDRDGVMTDSDHPTEQGIAAGLGIWEVDTTSPIERMSIDGTEIPIEPEDRLRKRAGQMVEDKNESRIRNNAIDRMANEGFRATIETVKDVVRLTFDGSNDWNTDAETA